MVKLLEEVIERLRDLPEPEQEAAAQMLLAFVEDQSDPEELDEETLAAIQEGLDQVERGEVVPQAEMDEFFRRLGV